MKYKQVLFYLGCAAAWFVLLPVFVVGGGLALFGYAVLTEVGEFFTGTSKKAEENSARETARRLCIGQ